MWDPWYGESCTGIGGGLTFEALAGVTYYFQADNFWNNAGSGLEALNLKLVPPAPNDNFDGATVIGALPFTATVDITGSTPAADDPTACGNSLRNANR